MILRVIRTALAALIVVCATATWAGEAVDKAVIDTLRSMLEQTSMGLEIATVEASEIEGMYAVQFRNGPMVYSTGAGDYFISGDLFSVGPGGFVNLGEKRRDAERVEQLASVGADDMIVFSPVGEPRAAITVFTDATCFYCQKLHKEVPELNKQGIEVRYLAYPRAGIGSDSYKQLATAWCATDRQGTLTKLKNRETVPNDVCSDNPVAAQYLLGQKMGVNGTPAMVTEGGRMIPGYQSAADLMVTLGLN
ncbi:MAG: DsbC family protein [Halieaceae bacterium]|nr:DsbC family protein [Halieaceae bacterium]